MQESQQQGSKKVAAHVTWRWRRHRGGMEAVTAQERRRCRLEREDELVTGKGRDDN